VAAMLEGKAELSSLQFGDNDIGPEGAEARSRGLDRARRWCVCGRVGGTARRWERQCDF
jgi:hypothetical protein